MTDAAKPFLIAVVGCTAGGKSALAIELARRHGGEIVSCDSMQIYRGMDIGTAKPSVAERAEIPHWMIDIADPTDPRGYSCADYVRDARVAVENILERGKLPILCGGTGLYIDAFLRGGAFEMTNTDSALRDLLTARAQREGAESLHRELTELDPQSAAAIHPHNVKRVVRALEIYYTTGRKKSEFDRLSREREADCPYQALVIGLRYTNRNILYDRINRRVDQMMADGLPEEAIRLRKAGVFDLCRTAAQAIGYKELFPWLDGRETRETAVETLKAATRRYAKRQITWFTARPYVTWVNADTECGLQKFKNIVNNVEKLFS